MNKRIIHRGVFALVLIAGLTACNEKKNTQSEISSPQLRLPQPSTAPVSDTERKNSYQTKLGGREYAISIVRRADSLLSRVKDETGKEYYDNRVEITVTRDNEAFFSRSFTKNDFLGELSENEERGTVLLGMAFDESRSDERTLCFGAQIGQPGIEEGPAFTVTVRLDNKQQTIARDNEQDSTGEDMME